MNLSTDLRCLFTAEPAADTDGDGYTVTVPEREVTQGLIEPGNQYRIAILSTPSAESPATDRPSTAANAVNGPGQEQAPPVGEGETRELEIESLGDQGDGIAKVERGFVVIVPDTDVGERVTVEIADVGPNVAFAEVVERHHEI